MFTDIFRDLGQTARAYQMNSDFARVIQQQIVCYHDLHIDICVFKIE
jgi:hypothetical protein